MSKPHKSVSIDVLFIKNSLPFDMQNKMMCGLGVFDFSCHDGCCAYHRSLCIQHRLLCFLGNSSSSEICSLLPSKTCSGGATTADFKVVCNHCQKHCATISLGLSVAPLILSSSFCYVTVSLLVD